MTDINFTNINDDDNLNTDEFYAKFKNRLEDTTVFPSDYTYKFIYPTSEETMNFVKDIFKNTNASFDYKASKNRKYTSISVKIYVIDADQVINYYKEVSKINGVIML